VPAAADGYTDLYVANVEAQENQIFTSSRCSEPGYRSGGAGGLCFGCPTWSLARTVCRGT
jgi:hypothetical protein